MITNSQPKNVVAATNSDDDSPTQKRRKVRKGTQSCWECRRRKAKCSLSTPGHPPGACDGCRRRGSNCISQEFPEDPANQRQQLGDRIGRVEELMTRLASGLERQRLQGVGADTVAKGMGYTDGEARAGQRNEDVALNWNEQLADTQATIIGLATVPGGQRDRLRGISNALMAAWPSAKDLEVIVNFPKGTAPVFHGLLCLPYYSLLEQPLPTPRQLFQRPDPRSHPVLIARSLLALAIFLQNFCQSEADAIAHQLTVSVRDMETRAFETSLRLVTTDDELVASVEGVECIMRESIYRNNAGHLRLSLLSIRRALTTAQVIGLNRGGHSRLLGVLDVETRRRIKPDHMWFRVVQWDRYISLHLGLPQGTVENEFAPPDQADCTDGEKLERGLAIATGRIIQRNASGMHDLELTKEVDELLLRGANYMSPQWWLCPDMTTPFEDQRDLVRHTNRFMTQMAHYTALERLHLPFLLRPSAAGEYDYNKMTAIGASRELLGRFLVFRNAVPPSATFCRGVDFGAFASCTAICLGHIDARLGRESNTGSGAMFNYLAHSRHNDRGIMERVLACFESVKSITSDPIAHRIYDSMESLLAIEADLANGRAFRAEALYRDSAETDDFGCVGTPDDAGQGLEVHLPHMGKIRIRPHGSKRALERFPVLAKQSAKHMPVPEHKTDYSERDWISSGNTTQVFTGQEQLIGFDQHSNNPWTMGQNFSYSFDFDIPQAYDANLPSFYAGDDISLQGVDTAFFDGLFLQPNGY